MFSNLIKQLDRAASSQAPKASKLKNSKKNNNKTSTRRKFDAWTRRRMDTAALPAAYATHVTPRFRSSIVGDEVRISGCDLVYNIPTAIVSGEYTLFTVIPSNPAYWDGTRIAQLAPAYMNYRPLRLSFHYIPQVAVTQSGTVFMGTLWNGAPAGDNIQQTLVTSNGGCLSQCYIPADTNIKLGSNLQQNLFTMNGSLNPDTSPFVFVAGIAGASVVPGYFYVSYEYAFKNPIGQSWIYNVDSPVALSAISPEAGVNQSVLLLEPTDGFGAGTIFDSETDGLYYRGSRVTLASELQVAVFENRQGGAAVMRSRARSAYVFDISGWQTSSGGDVAYKYYYIPESRVLRARDAVTTAAVPDGARYTAEDTVVLPPCVVQYTYDANVDVVVQSDVEVKL